VACFWVEYLPWVRIERIDPKRARDGQFFDLRDHREVAEMDTVKVSDGHHVPV